VYAGMTVFNLSVFVYSVFRTLFEPTEMQS
jgi:hypothetical protein